nr:BTAD domain-containing putative transcriptional regulator [Anaerolinea sp.]
MSRLEISLLGSFMVVLDGADVTHTLRTRKESAIFAYLVEESPRSFPREMIAELFWPDRPGNYARMNLRQALLGVRKTLGGDDSSNDFLRISDATVQFNPVTAWRDTGEFSSHLQATVNHAHAHLHTCEDCVQHFEQAVDCYHGDFLDGVTLGDVSSFQEWLVVHRERYFRYMLDALRSLSKIYSQRASFDQAYRYAWRYVDLA